MREILFRAKSVWGDWREGFLVKTGNHFRISMLNDLVSVGCDPETVGQFTGLIDNNGRKIFEGDIVEGHCHSQWRHDMQRCVVAYGRDGFECRHHIGGVDTEYYVYRVLFSKDVAVIGNIYDNPELLDVRREKEDAF